MPSLVDVSSVHLSGRNHDRTILRWEIHRHQMLHHSLSRPTHQLHKMRKTVVLPIIDENGHGNEHWLCLVRVMRLPVMWKKKKTFQSGGECSARSFPVDQ